MPADPNDPLDPASPVTPLDLIARTEAKFSYRMRVVARYLIGRPLRRYPPPSSTPAIVAVSIATAVCLVSGLWITIPRHDPPVPTPFYFSERPAPLALPATGDRGDGKLRLSGLVNAVRKADAATQMPLHVQVWDQDAPADPHGYIARDEHRWYGADGTPYLRITQLPPQRNGSVTAFPPADPRAEGTALPRTSALPTDVAEMAEALSTRDRRLLRALAELYRTANLGSDQRANIFRVLAETELVLGRGVITDRMGRRGLAFTTDLDGERDLIVVDPDTGALLSYERYEIGDSSPICQSYLIFFSA